MGFLLLFVAIAAILVRFGTPEDTWLCKEGEWVAHGNPSTPQPTTGCGTPAPTGAMITPSTTITQAVTNFLDYKNVKLDYSLKYPENMKVEPGYDTEMMFTFWGSTQKANTELYDGISVDIVQSDLGTNKDLRSVANADIERNKEGLQADFKVINPLSAFKTGYYYKSEEPYGMATYYYLPQKSGKYLLVTVRTPDPNDQGYASISAKLVNSIVY